MVANQLTKVINYELLSYLIMSILLSIKIRLNTFYQCYFIVTFRKLPTA